MKKTKFYSNWLETSKKRTYLFNLRFLSIKMSPEREIPKQSALE